MSEKNGGDVLGGCLRTPDLPPLGSGICHARSESRAESSADIGYETTVKEYRAFYDAGYRNASVEDVQWDSGSMTVDQKAEAWQAGYNARNSGIEKGKTTAFVNQGQQGKAIESPEALDFGKQNPTAKKALDKLAKAWGVNIEIGNYGDRINGSIKDGVIRLNAQKFTGENRNQVVARIFAHEITHRMQETAVEGYTRYRDYVLDIYAQNGTLDSVIREFQHRYQDAGETITREEAMDEIASDFTQEFLSDTQMVKDFLAESEENRSWFKKIIDWAKGLLAKLKKNGTKETNALLAEVENALKLWEKAYAEGIKAVKNAPVRESTGEDVSRNSVDVDSTQKLYQGVNLSEDSSVYTYEFLTSLPDMQIVALPDVDSIRTNGKVDTAKVVSEGMKNARTVGAERDGKVLVNNLYTGGLLRINTNTIRHGLNGSTNRLLTNSRLGAIIGDVVHNAVPINALHNKAENVTGTYAMVQYARDSKGREFIAVVTVEQKSHNISDIEVYDVVHALSGRQKKSSQASTKLQSINSIKAATISIADVLRAVKDTHQSILSESVLDHFNEQRNQNGDYAGKAKFSISGTENILQEAEERAAAERDALERLRYLRKQVAVTKQKTADPKSVDKIAKQLIQKWGADLETEDIAQDLQVLYDHALRLDEVEIWDEAMAIGRRFAEGFTEVEGDIYREYANLRKELRGMHIYVSPEAKRQDIPCSLVFLSPFSENRSARLKQ